MIQNNVKPITRAPLTSVNSNTSANSNLIQNSEPQPLDIIDPESLPVTEEKAPDLAQEPKEELAQVTNDTKKEPKKDSLRINPPVQIKSGKAVIILIEKQRQIPISSICINNKVFYETQSGSGKFEIQSGTHNISWQEAGYCLPKNLLTIIISPDETKTINLLNPTLIQPAPILPDHVEYELRGEACTFTRNQSADYAECWLFAKNTSEKLALVRGCNKIFRDAQGGFDNCQINSKAQITNISGNKVYIVELSLKSIFLDYRTNCAESEEVEFLRFYNYNIDTKIIEGTKFFPFRFPKISNKCDKIVFEPQNYLIQFFPGFSPNEFERVKSENRAIIERIKQTTGFSIPV